MFSFELDGTQDSPAYVPVRRSRSNRRLHDPQPTFRRKRRVRIPRGWIGRPPGFKPLKRLRAKERLTWYRWLWDWSTSLHKLGFVSRNDLVTSKRTAITDNGLRKKECICLVSRDTAIFLYASVHAVPVVENESQDQYSEVYRIVRGRRPDSSAGVKQLEDGSTAVGIIPKVEMAGRTSFLVEFDGNLFELKDGKWCETTDENVLAIYRGYRANSNHLTKFRPRRRKSEIGQIRPKDQILRNLNFDHSEPKFDFIRELK